jgi:hypothetical protein
MEIYYLVIKGAFLFGLARSYVSFEPLQKHALFLSILYTAGVGFLSQAIYLPTHPLANLQRWEIWLAETFALFLIYLKLLARFDEGLLFWIIFLAGGIGLIYF